MRNFLLCFLQSSKQGEGKVFWIMTSQIKLRRLTPHFFLFLLMGAFGKWGFFHDKLAVLAELGISQPAPAPLRAVHCTAAYYSPTRCPPVKHYLHCSGLKEFPARSLDPTVGKTTCVSTPQPSQEGDKTGAVQPSLICHQTRSKKQGSSEPKEASHEVFLLINETRNQPNHCKRLSQLIINHPFMGNLAIMERCSRSGGSSRWDWLVLPEDKHKKHQRQGWKWPCLPKLCIGDGFCFCVKGRKETQNHIITVHSCSLSKQGAFDTVTVPNVSPELQPSHHILSIPMTALNSIHCFVSPESGRVCANMDVPGATLALHGVIRAAASASLPFVLVWWSVLRPPPPENAAHLFLLAKFFAALQEGEGFNQTLSVPGGKLQCRQNKPPKTEPPNTPKPLQVQNITHDEKHVKLCSFFSWN